MLGVLSATLLNGSNNVRKFWTTRAPELHGGAYDILFSLVYGLVMFFILRLGILRGNQTLINLESCAMVYKPGSVEILMSHRQLYCRRQNDLIVACKDKKQIIAEY